MSLCEFGANEQGSLPAKHHSSFSPGVDVTEQFPNFVDTDTLDTFPLAEFCFKYRSQGSSQMESR
jgi:hypothetical protein